ncbi:hypothetical protein DMN91_003628 [Ooceraea biroi]|uniref:Uncharacterized protein n=1 Tax=Ooceraea biroi TaxID=2015173 RepID=A0A3L8DSP3_OOCBI|nr:hypothetical protein DMN91_003628 [Ooceraea biroi]
MERTVLDKNCKIKKNVL